MIESPFIIMEDGTRTVKATDKAGANAIYEGSPVSLDANGQLVKASQTMKVYGLSKLDCNTFRDFAFGEYGAFGTQKLTVICQGQCRVASSVFNKIEVDTATVTGGSTTVALFDGTKAYVPGEALYVNAGLISNVKADGTSYIGKVLAPCLVGDQWLEIAVAPLALDTEIAAA
jgi:hypothetical protein